jgi:hypothetical protein
MKRLCGLSYVVLTFLGALNMKRVLGFLFAVFATLWMAAPAAAWNNDSSEPGSVLVFYKFEAGNDEPVSILTPDQGIVPQNAFQVTVTCPNGSMCPTSGQTVRLKGHWVCAGDCSENDFHVSATVNGTILFDTGNIYYSLNPRPAGAVFVTPPTCAEGYLILWVVNDLDQAIKFDGLMGHEVIRDTPFTSRAINGLPIQAAESLNTLDPTDVNGNGALDFDGTEYHAITGTIYGSVEFNEDTSLTLLTLDVDSGRPNNTTDVDLLIYNQDELGASAHAHFTCWDDFNVKDFIGEAPSSFGREGLIQSTNASQTAPDGTTKKVTLIGIVETEEEFTAPVTGLATGSFTFSVGPKLPCTLDAMAMTVTCTNVTFFASTPVDLQRERTYPLYNDSMPVSTAFIPH